MTVLQVHHSQGVGEAEQVAAGGEGRGQRRLHGGAAQGVPASARLRGGPQARQHRALHQGPHQACRPWSVPIMFVTL